MKDKKQDVRQNAKIEDKKLDQVQGGVVMTQLITGSMTQTAMSKMDVLHR